MMFNRNHFIKKNTRVLKSILLITLVFSVVACAPSPIMEIPDLANSSTVKVIDLRPENEKEDIIFSYLISSKAYALYRFGDQKSTPSPIRILQHRVHQHFLPKKITPEVKVHHFAVYMNAQSQFRASAIGSAFGGGIGTAIVASGYGVIDGKGKKITNEEFNAIDEEYKKALYTQEENPDKASVYIVYLDADINGERQFVKTITPAQLKDGKNPHHNAVEAAVAYYLSEYNKL